MPGPRSPEINPDTLDAANKDGGSDNQWWKPSTSQKQTQRLHMACYAVSNKALQQFPYKVPSDEPLAPGVSHRRGTILENSPEAHHWEAAMMGSVGCSLLAPWPLARTILQTREAVADTAPGVGSSLPQWKTPSTSESRLRKSCVACWHFCMFSRKA